MIWFVEVLKLNVSYLNPLVCIYFNVNYWKFLDIWVVIFEQVVWNGPYYPWKRPSSTPEGMKHDRLNSRAQSSMSPLSLMWILELDMLSPEHCTECKSDVLISWSIIDQKKPTLVVVNRWQLILVQQLSGFTMWTQ